MRQHERPPRARPVTLTPATSTTRMKDRHGVQLLSPTLHRGLRASNQYEVTKPAVFDCDTFSLEAARQCHERARASASRSSSSPRSASGLFRTESSHANNPPSVRSMDEVYDWGHSSRGTHVSSIFTSSASGRVYPSISKRMSVASSTTSSSLPTTANTTTHIVVGGWLQRRRGRVLKRWKAQYCVLKSDSKLCLYANEDTVNGRLEGRFHLLRVTYNDRHQSFQVIGLGSDETPFKEELRPLDDDGWRVWFLALRAFLPPESIHEALERMPELSLLPGIHASLHEDDEDDDDDEDYGHEIEDMVLRPYRSSVATSDSTSASSHRPQRVHSFASAASANDRKTVLFDPADLVPTSSNNQHDETAAVEAMTWRPPRAASKLYTGGTRRPSSASRTSSSATSSTTNDERRGGGRNPHALAHGVLAGTVDTRASSGVDCPMIERDSQNTVAMLERVGSESVVSSRESDSGYSWNRA